MSITMIIILAVVGIVLISIIAMYNNLITLKNRFKNAFAQISVQLQRRYDLIPNLVETAKKYMQFEQDTLTKVIEARNNAQAANKLASVNPANADNIKALTVADTTLTKSLSGFFALSENYPDLKASQPMQQLMEELTSTENKVGFARQGFNDAVMVYNTACEQFPSSLIAKTFNFTHAELLELENQEVKKAVKVSFD